PVGADGGVSGGGGLSAGRSATRPSAAAPPTARAPARTIHGLQRIRRLPFAPASPYIAIAKRQDRPRRTGAQARAKPPCPWAQRWRRRLPRAPTSRNCLDKECTNSILR